MIALLELWAGGAILLMAVMSAAWFVQKNTNQGGWVDSFWSFGLGAAGGLVALWPIEGAAPSSRQWLAAAMIGAWGLRLGTYLAHRSATATVEDPRYAAMRKSWGARFQIRMYGMMVIQAAAATMLCLSVLVAARHPASGEGVIYGLQVQDLIAAAIFIVAWIGEALSDQQMAAFKANPDNHGKVCDTGLWAWSRHPNYFFEWLGWCVWPVMGISLSGQWHWGWLALVGPVYMYWLLNHVSGVPLLEAYMKRSRPEAFALYKARVSRFFPRPPKAS